MVTGVVNVTFRASIVELARVPPRIFNEILAGNVAVGDTMKLAPILKVGLAAAVKEEFAPAVKLPSIPSIGTFGKETVPLLIKLPMAPIAPCSEKEVRELNTMLLLTLLVIPPFITHADMLLVKMPLLVSCPLTVKVAVPVPTVMVPLLMMSFVLPPFVLIKTSVGELPRSNVVPEAMVSV